MDEIGARHEMRGMGLRSIAADLRKAADQLERKADELERIADRRRSGGSAPSPG